MPSSAFGGWMRTFVFPATLIIGKVLAVADVKLIGQKMRLRKFRFGTFQVGISGSEILLRRGGRRALLREIRFQICTRGILSETNPRFSVSPLVRNYTAKVFKRQKYYLRFGCTKDAADLGAISEPTNFPCSPRSGYRRSVFGSATFSMSNWKPSIEQRQPFVIRCACAPHLGHFFASSLILHTSRRKISMLHHAAALFVG